MAFGILPTTCNLQVVSESHNMHVFLWAPIIYRPAAGAAARPFPAGSPKSFGSLLPAPALRRGTSPYSALGSCPLPSYDQKGILPSIREQIQDARLRDS